MDKYAARADGRNMPALMQRYKVTGNNGLLAHLLRSAAGLRFSLYLSGSRESVSDHALDYLRLLDLRSNRTYFRSVGSSGGGLL